MLSAPTLSSSRGRFVVPRMETIHGFWASSQASAAPTISTNDRREDCIEFQTSGVSLSDVLTKKQKALRRMRSANS